MADSFLGQPVHTRREALLYASEQLGRLPDLLEKDLWVVWALEVIYSGPLAGGLTFKGGTSLSKAYQIIDRFSEDLDLTCDIRRMLPEHAAESGLPSSAAQEKRWRGLIDVRLPDWIANTFVPGVSAALVAQGLAARLNHAAPDQVELHYSSALDTAERSYVRPTVLFEFGARATGEPHGPMPVSSDIASVSALSDAFALPHATPVVMGLSRTFWEKATAAHVYCMQQRLRAERFARHWYDLAAMFGSVNGTSMIRDRNVADMVAAHKSWFFKHNDAGGNRIDYWQAVRGALVLVPQGAALGALHDDYLRMLDAGLLPEGAPAFDQVLSTCALIEAAANGAAPSP
ncbi:hypothetical protein CEK29_12950 [Bordetella genomosp. 5]|uniref:nucleotidyl transferase AbiEii/AbiGii toxin family protein n=1 Tax=Bordetella genomosp. 5 TaxID=1395608 RepID=UPI000B9E4C1E|nr:nucleotidyl transferase AbiEii/AbiGii toxin family protein [Bordetella genomosp. 5]OZI42002.1 hypothetical protein CEK29_12950 [Bordetella genomosp. 5]